jgi:hypothetical protein
MKARQVLIASIAVATVAGCATSHVMIGHARAPISPESVRVYTRPPDGGYDEIARLDTSSQGSFSFTAQAKTDAVLARLRKEAASLGANGVLLEGMGDRPSGSVGTGGGSESYSGSGAVGGGIGLSFGMTQKVASAIAIYVPQGEAR